MRGCGIEMIRMVLPAVRGRCGRAGRSGGIVIHSLNLPVIRPLRPAWNKGRIVGHKRPLLPKHVWAIRARLELADRGRDLALFNMAVDSKLRGCDLVSLKGGDVVAAGRVKERTSVSEQDREAGPVRDHRGNAGGTFSLDREPGDDRLRVPLARPLPCPTAYLDAAVWSPAEGMGRPDGARVECPRHPPNAPDEGRSEYKKTGNLRAVQILLGHKKMDSTVRYLGIQVEGALDISERVEIWGGAGRIPAGPNLTLGSDAGSRSQHTMRPSVRAAAFSGCEWQLGG